jgi:phage host-nuclease inhibitor protein Gam
MSRIKPAAAAPVLKNLEDVDATLAQIAALKRNVALVETDMNETIDTVKMNAAAEVAPFNAEIAWLEQALARYAEYNKAELFARRKSMDLTFGTLGYRASTKIRLLTKMTWERVLENLRDLSGGAEFIRVKAEPDKEKLKGMSDDFLKGVGCKVVQENTFFYELAEQELSTEPGDAA